MKLVSVNKNEGKKEGRRGKQKQKKNLCVWCLCVRKNENAKMNAKM